jgi:hypothetical protein
VKYKVAHKRADRSTWSASDRARRKRTVQILREMIADIEAQEPAPPQRHETKAPPKTRAPRLASRRRTRTAQRRRPPVRRRSTSRRRAISAR